MSSNCSRKVHHISMAKVCRLVDISVFGWSGLCDEVVGVVIAMLTTRFVKIGRLSIGAWLKSK